MLEDVFVYRMLASEKQGLNAVWKAVGYALRTLQNIKIVSA